MEQTLRIIKSMRTGLLHRTFLYRRQNLFTVSMLWGFRLDTGDNVIEPYLWQTIGKLLEAGQPFDQAMPKGQGEFLVNGSFHAPAGQEVTGGSVSVSVGGLEKQLSVVGDRFWGGIGMSRPEPFTHMPINYRHAFGGEGYAKNTRGKGFAPVADAETERHPLPNVEYVGQAVASPGDRPSPAAFDHLDIMWEQRSKYSGTYDETYLREAFLGLPDDLDWRYFNDGAQDQWFENFLRGDEAFEIRNMHPQQSLIRGHLPAIHGRCFVEQETADEESVTRIREIPLRADTVWLFPGEMVGVVIFRGTIDAMEDDGSDIRNLLLAAENMSDQPRPAQHYIDELKKRADPDQGFKYLLQPGPLLPLGCRSEFDELISQADPQPQSCAISANMENYANNKKAELEREAEKNTERLMTGLEKEGLAGRGAGQLDIQAILSEKPPARPEEQKINELLDEALPGLRDDPGKMSADKLLSTMDQGTFEKLNNYLDALKSEQLAKAREQIQDSRRLLEQQLLPLTDDESRQGVLRQIDQLDRLLAEDLGKAQTSPLPRLEKDLNAQIVTQDEIFDRQRLQLQAVLPPGTEETRDALDKLDRARDMSRQQMTSAIEQVRDQYRLSAHFLGPASSPHPGEEAGIAVKLLAAAKAGEATAGGDYAFTDLSQRSLRGIDLRGACLEYADLSGCDLSGADLTGAVLTHATLIGTRFSNTRLYKANLGHCRIEEAVFENCDMIGVVLSYAFVAKSRFEHCDLSGGMFSFHKTRFSETLFDSVKLDDHVFLESVFDNCHLNRCSLDKTVFLQSKMDATQFCDCDLEQATLLMTEANNSVFRHCRMRNARLMGGCQLKRADFSGSILNEATFRDACLEYANFSGAQLNQSDLSSVEATGACFDRTVARRSLWYKAELRDASLRSVDLMEASLHKARLQGADFTGASLFGANLLQVTLSDTDFRDCILTRTLLQDWRPAVT
jgi:uncharacterized protein YjbI with pentapeptide repeats